MAAIRVHSGVYSGLNIHVENRPLHLMQCWDRGGGSVVHCHSTVDHGGDLANVLMAWQEGVCNMADVLQPEG